MRLTLFQKGENMILRIRALLTALYVHDVDYVIFGSSGAMAYGANIVTSDLDICPSTDKHNIKRISRCLKTIDARPDFIPPHNTMQEVMSWCAELATVENLDKRFMTKFGQLDIQPAPYGARGKDDRLNYDILVNRATSLEIFGIMIQVAHIDDLIASKMSRKRAKDLRVEAELRRVQGLVHQGIIIPNLSEDDIVKQTIF